uniref:aspartyl aminopeptidase n=1 Tax=Corethron hystrix TaxID=216773 RepID=A0A7S1B960_9STRA|mmetsp:Transcript_17666/g.40021  ORF Transcript_17666/g.40021 Transcript_17666/m.40021 type:complete len:264 (+) Transcript_17666:316-1107(+)
MTTVAECLPLARKACDYLTASPDPYHAVNNAATKLRVAGFECLQARKPFAGKMRPGGKYYYTQDDTAIVAFTIGTQLDVDRPYGFKIIAGHTDSPNLRVKPRSKRTSAGECVQLAVECYGGGLWHTWFDRDLGVSGKVLVRNGSSIESKFVLIELPVARVSNLAIHLATADERAAFRVNKEDHLQPIIGTKSVLEEEAKEQLQDGWTEFQEPELLSLISAELGVEAKCIVDFDLCLFDMQPAAIAGIKSEFVHSGRLDNLATW